MLERLFFAMPNIKENKKNKKRGFQAQTLRYSFFCLVINQSVLSRKGAGGGRRRSACVCVCWGGGGGGGTGEADVTHFDFPCNFDWGVRECG